MVAGATKKATCAPGALDRAMNRSGGPLRTPFRRVQPGNPARGAVDVCRPPADGKVVVVVMVMMPILSRIVEMNELPIKLMNVPTIPMPTTIVTIAIAGRRVVIGYRSP